MTKECEVLGFDEADKIASMVEASRKLSASSRVRYWTQAKMREEGMPWRMIVLAIAYGFVEHAGIRYHFVPKSA